MQIKPPHLKVAPTDNTFQGLGCTCVVQCCHCWNAGSIFGGQCKGDYAWKKAPTAHIINTVMVFSSPHAHPPSCLALYSVYRYIFKCIFIWKTK